MLQHLSNAMMDVAHRGTKCAHGAIDVRVTSQHGFPHGGSICPSVIA